MQGTLLILDAGYPSSKAYDEWKSSIHTSVAEAVRALNRDNNLYKFHWSRGVGSVVNSWCEKY